MFEILGIPSQALFGQLLIGLINGSFYALLSLGLAVIFGMLNIINFTHGALYMMGAFVAWMLLQLSRARLLVGAGRSRRSSSALIGIVIERLLLQWLYQLDHLYGLLLTFGLALIIEGAVPQLFRLVRACPTAMPGRAARRAATSASCSCRTTAPG